MVYVIEPPQFLFGHSLLFDRAQERIARGELVAHLGKHLVDLALLQHDLLSLGFAQDQLVLDDLVEELLAGLQDLLLELFAGMQGPVLRDDRGHHQLQVLFGDDLVVDDGEDPLDDLGRAGRRAPKRQEQQRGQPDLPHPAALTGVTVSDSIAFSL